MTQRVVVESLLPVTRSRSIFAPAEEQTLHALDDFLFEPDRGALLERLVPMYVETSLLRALYESSASEHGARMTAMDSATKNAKELTEALTLHMNRVRQASITTAIIEVVSGAAALE